MTHPMSIPGYDAWRLRGPEESGTMMEACEDCEGIGKQSEQGILFTCPACNGTGEVEITLDEPDGDYEYERRRDAREDRG
jgi:predicted RNA-binding Zn-ribbon protein involved in translation (DUF1610 family)